MTNSKINIFRSEYGEDQYDIGYKVYFSHRQPFMELNKETLLYLLL